ncbi:MULTISPECIES: KAP family P-loop NTPase fold protein [Nocardiaceae]|uniref:KAP family P-loop NTPase fold protein n=1 Tax=Nocardiaceae TaxID=85025 RepID=UPI0002ABA258|nr:MULTISPECIES: P-loop NTPase fold protein [Rhodococcus]MCC8930770.1 hypothetical protein [Rhodococcus sp. I2R]MDJ0470954.1 P-loop NTPase fold protein [Rhodococcus fascians]CCQ13386.1 KAP family P-loop domain protein [Rhodococcus sp. AW25M09]
MNAPESSAGPGEVKINLDTEIKLMVHDRLDRKQYARRVAQRIQQAGTGSSVVFGLAGPWGTGKTSVLNMITEVITTENADSWSVVAFTPWSAGDSLTLVEEFYQVIAGAMPTSTEGKRVRRALAAAAPVGSAIIKAVGTSAIEKWIGEGGVQDALLAGKDAFAEKVGDFTAAIEPNPFSERFRAVSDAIQAAGKNVLVIVDDIDRLHADELLSVMKSVRLLGRFDRVHYLLSYDEETVLDVLEKTDLASNNRSRARRYLEKIIQYPFALPPIQQVHLATEFREHLNAIIKAHSVIPATNSVTLTDEDEDEDEDNMNRESIPDLLLGVLPTELLTLRSIYRLCTQVDIMLTLVGGNSELDFFDATVITFIRLHYPALYKQIPRWRTELLGSGTPTIGKKEVTAEEKQAEVARYTDTKDDFENKSVYVLLVSLFPDALPRPKGSYTPTRHAHCQIRDANYFARYFAFGLPAQDIRDSDVRTDFERLTDTGDWSSTSIIREALPIQERRRLVRGKIMQQLDVIADASPQMCFSAAHLLTREIPTDGADLVFSRWSEVLYALTGHAMSRAEPDAARDLISGYRNEFGLSTTADVLARPIELLGINQAKVLAATSEIRQQVLERCMTDLTTAIPRDQRGTHSILSFIHYLDDDLWQQLSEQAQALLHNGDVSVSLASLGARFVSMSERIDSDGNLKVVHHRFESNDFAKLIPRDLWKTDELPIVTQADLRPDDTSLENRTVYATLALRQLVDRAES